MAATEDDTPLEEAVTVEELTAKAAQKRYEGLVMVRTKAIKGKGAWYWAHLEPFLVHNTDTALPKAVKLRCSLCDAVFSASNPSRTSSEHLKRGTCPNFVSSEKPLSTAPARQNHRKRASSSAAGISTNLRQIPPVNSVDAVRFSGYLTYSPETPSAAEMQQPHYVPSGGKEDLGAMVLVEDSVKKLKSPKLSPNPNLNKSQIDSAFDFLADWVYESCGSVSFSSLEHPKFQAFLGQVGLPAISPREIPGHRLDAKYSETKSESETRIGDAMFFQISSNGWKPKNTSLQEHNLVNLTVNLPNGTTLYRKAMFVTSSAPSSFAEDVLSETITGICGNAVQQCVGIVSDRFKSKALKNVEDQKHWMVNLSCQLQAFNSLLQDFAKELPLFKSVSQNCLNLANFVNDNTQIRNALKNYHLQELIHIPSKGHENDFDSVCTMLDRILSSARVLRMVLMDCNSIKTWDIGFWGDLEAVVSLVKLVQDMAREIELERPLVGQCLPLWNNLRSKIEQWTSKFQITDDSVINLIERRFVKNYHPAWAAAFILDPLYLIRDISGKNYLPPFKYLTPEQEKDVDRLITRLVDKEDAHIALMELMKWRTEGLDPVYAMAVQMKERDPNSGKMRLSNPRSSRLVWETHLSGFKSLGKVAVRLIFLHATTCCGFKCDRALMRWVAGNDRRRGVLERAEKLVFLAAHAKLERRATASYEDSDVEILGFENGDDSSVYIFS